MGYKDENWREAPGYCVECDNLRPLNNAGVCEECWNALPPSHFEAWEEDEYSSKWYYEQSRGYDDASQNLNTYVFVTTEGFTYQLDSEAIEPDIENLQVIGFGEGLNPDEALADMLETHQWIQNTTFSEVLCYQLAPKARSSVTRMSLH